MSDGDNQIQVRDTLLATTVASNAVQAHTDAEAIIATGTSTVSDLANIISILGVPIGIATGRPTTVTESIGAAMSDPMITPSGEIQIPVGEILSNALYASSTTPFVTKLDSPLLVTTNSSLVSINNNISSVNTELDSINSNINASNIYLGLIHDDLALVNYKLDSANGYLAAIGAKLDTANGYLATLAGSPAPDYTTLLTEISYALHGTLPNRIRQSGVDQVSGPCTIGNLIARALFGSTPISSNNDAVYVANVPLAYMFMTPNRYLARIGDSGTPTNQSRPILPTDGPIDFSAYTTNMTTSAGAGASVYQDSSLSESGVAPFIYVPTMWTLAAAAPYLQSSQANLEDISAAYNIAPVSGLPSIRTNITT
jgi:hypothetical protein